MYILFTTLIDSGIKCSRGGVMVIYKLRDETWELFLMGFLRNKLKPVKHASIALRRTLTQTNTILLTAILSAETIYEKKLTNFCICVWRTC